MGLEVAPYVQDLVVSNPISGDDVNQGDDHIRLLKTTLKATFPGTTKPIYNSTAASKVASFTVVAADENKTFMVDATAGAVVATLPTLVSGDHGWMCFFIKMDTVNTFHVAPASGSVYSGQHSVARARRCIPGVRFSAAWSGSNWSIERVERNPVGAIIPLGAAALPAGYEWPNGQTLASASTNYPEYFAVLGGGGTYDIRGRAPFGKSNMGGSDNGLISSITGTSLGSMGGAQTVTLVQANLGSGWYFNTDSFTFTGTQAYTVDNYTSGYDIAHGHTGTVALSFDATASGAAFGGGNPSYVRQNNTALAIDTLAAGSLNHYHLYTPVGTVNHGYARAGGSDTAVNKMPPAIVLNFILVVE